LYVVGIAPVVVSLANMNEQAIVSMNKVCCALTM